MQRPHMEKKKNPFPSPLNQPSAWFCCNAAMVSISSRVPGTRAAAQTSASPALAATGRGTGYSGRGAARSNFTSPGAPLCPAQGSIFMTPARTRDLGARATRVHFDAYSLHTGVRTTAENPMSLCMPPFRPLGWPRTRPQTQSSLIFHLASRPRLHPSSWLPS